MSSEPFVAYLDRRGHGELLYPVSALTLDHHYALLFSEDQEVTSVGELGVEGVDWHASRRRSDVASAETQDSPTCDDAAEAMKMS